MHRFSGSIQAWALVVACFGTVACKPLAGTPSTLAVFEAKSLEEVCANAAKDQTVAAHSVVKVGGWNILGFQLRPCQKQSALGLTDEQPRNLAVILGVQDDTDRRIARNTRELAEIHRAAGDAVILVNPKQEGDIAQAIDRFAAANPGYQAQNATIYGHGHGGATADDTFLGGVDDQREQGVALPPGREARYQVSTLSAADETLRSLGRQGIVAPETNCTFALGSCEAGGAINGMQNNWSYWNDLGLDGAVGASRADESSSGSGRVDQDLPQERLLSDMALLHSDAQFAAGMDRSGDGQVSMAEHEAATGGELHSSVFASSGGHIGPSGPQLPHPASQENHTQHLVFAGDMNTTLSPVPAASAPVAEATQPAASQATSAPVAAAPAQGQGSLGIPAGL